VRQGRLYYLRGKVGREARIRERRRLIAERPEAEEPEEAQGVAAEAETAGEAEEAKA